MPSKRQIDVGGVKIGGGAPVAVQSMTKTETADYDATLRQIRAIADAGGGIVRGAGPREKDGEAPSRLLRPAAIPGVRGHHLNHPPPPQGDEAGAHPTPGDPR